MQLPVNSSVAVSLRAKAEAEEQERAEMKRLVLQAHQQDSFDYVPLPKVKQTLLNTGGPQGLSGSPKAAPRPASRGGSALGARGFRSASRGRG